MPKLMVFPGWFSINPYLNLLYLDASAQGFEVSGYTDLLLFLRNVKSAKSGDVIHLHWTAPIAQEAKDEKAARANIKLLEKALRQAKSRSVKLIWTVHNAIPHETKFFDIEVELCKLLCELVDSIHVLADNTAEELSELYVLPAEKVVKVGLSSYWGIYDQTASKAHARAELGVRENETAALIMGMNRGYKALDQAVDNLAKAATGPLVILMSSEVSKSDLAKFSLPKNVRMIAADHFLTTEELSVWLTAADFAVFTFDKILNSSSVFLAATFGLPFVAPALGNIPEVFEGRSFAELYVPDATGENLRAAITKLVKNHEALSVQATEFSKARKPYDMALEFTQKLLSQ